MMRYKNNKTSLRTGLTLLEMVIAVAIMTIIFTAILPLFASIRNSWDTKQANAELLQNGRVLIDHFYRNLSKAVKVNDVSDSSETDGYIQFEDNDGNNWRYERGTNNYVQFGAPGDLYDLAGPVSALQFTCYGPNDFNNPTTEVNSIRFITVQTTFTNSAVMGHNKTLTTSAYLRTNWNSGDPNFIAWWKLDETSGLTAADSSGNGNNGTLQPPYGPPSWTTGRIDGALDFDGYNDYVSLPIGSVIDSLTNCTVATWVDWDGSSPWKYDWQRIWDFGSGDSLYMFLTPNSADDTLRFAITEVGWWDEEQTEASVTLPSGWFHVTVIIDADNHTHKLYLDGSPVAQNTSGYLVPSDLGHTNQNWLGRSQYSADPYFYGKLDDVRIYNRALEYGEISQLLGIVIFVDYNEAKVDSDEESITIDTPGDTCEGDLLIAAVATDGDTSTSMAPTDGDGWTEIDIDTYNGEVTLGAWWKLADFSEPDTHEFTWSGAGGQQAYGWIMRFTGHDTTDPIDVFSTYSESSSAPTSPAVITTVDNCLILRLGAFDDDDITVDDPNLPDHTAITMDESNSSSSGSVSILGSWTSGLTHTEESGTNRALVLIAHGEEALAAISLDSVKYGGQAMTKVIERIVGTNPRDYVVAYILNEAGVAAATSGTFVPTWSTTPDEVSYASVFLQNVNQAILIGDSASNSATSGATITTSALATSNGDMVIDAATCGNVGNYTVNNGFTEAIEFDMATSVGTSGYKSATGANETPSVTHVGTMNRQVIIGFVVQSGAGVSGTVSGGAGYVNQSSSGDSGTSNFLLTAENKAQMLTIAIAPNPQSEGDGGIRP